ncbi:MAG TPA: RsmB/NOP family class I SAM-dependent RNA methyltransferase [Candidatus Bathyarchaeia archaeon]|nr:RsmB/NOP family class I SAM-dependent RNA methyltransferase [Candidatus Bathyarchaeia archaeon]
MESRPPIPIDAALRESLTTVYDGRVDSVLESLGRMGPRYYFRLNRLAGEPSETIESMQSNQLKAELHENLPDAGYLPVTESDIEAQGHLVEADRFAAEAVMQGAHLYAPGVRNCQGLKAGMPSTVVDRVGTLVGSGIARQNETMILRYHRGIAVEVKNSRFRVPPLRETSWYRDGLIHLQSLPAMVTCRVLDPQPDETIVDLNCSPAGKMSYLCQLTENKARVFGFDRNEQKIDKAREHLERLHCKNYQLIAHDSRYAHLDYSIKADKVLVDPPCTGLGVTPKLSIDNTMADVENLSSYQKQFLTTAAAMVKQGGTVIYSVCTITPDECEGIVKFAEAKLGLLEVPAEPMHGRTGIGSRGQRFDPDLDGVGFFIAKFVKRG